jgi:hypothetical protein
MLPFLPEEETLSLAPHHLLPDDIRVVRRAQTFQKNFSRERMKKDFSRLKTTYILHQDYETFTLNDFLGAYDILFSYGEGTLLSYLREHIGSAETFDFNLAPGDSVPVEYLHHPPDCAVHVPVFPRAFGPACLPVAAFRQKGVTDTRQPAVRVEHRDRQAGAEHGEDKLRSVGEMSLAGLQVDNRQLFFGHDHDSFL